ncbi:phosphate/phosphite/phosphonate ABC transporter substrate-binding protein [Desulfobacca acetoxidans]|uniref:Phosphonate ABC transporter, periplasmic phosphonate-binding protein n=1 Tax=Desulfobacca acetoxidans (strain ATCC 700848 / DSM 11109 / ASRB2) TaxID=880072 RepID=F2NCD0_DESAR|nr:phosphate/phosphite/phosphonate ABC transporter substrate-binding protein [Desulfobacca acetoxidans]AEB08994.1 phosphonate ABC transporter, periplasmic phosphonate-binding protein [Desulfobacca acetoxidans DSM 11109]
MQFWRYFVVLLGIWFFLGACGEEEPVKKIDLSKLQELPLVKHDNAITYAYLPQYAHTVSYQRHHLVMDYLAKSTGLNIRQVFPDTFDEHMNMVGRGLIDITFSNPFIYVKIADRYGARAFARVVESVGKENFRGQIICRADNQQIKSLSDIKGKRLIAVDPTSAGGYLYPWGLILERGLRARDFSEVAFAPGPGGKQEKVVMAVYSGKYDVGLIREGTLEVVADKIDLKQIRVLAHSPWYPGWVYAARKDMNPAVVAKIKQALLALDIKNPDHQIILKKAGFIAVMPAQDSDFDVVRRLQTMVESKAEH